MQVTGPDPRRRRYRPTRLYVANATFGANAWGDCFALLARGFGAAGIRAAVAQMVRDRELPGL